jgi:hypothetical protein|tara:strand:+ start:412 stop:729 length:318 start_codon:yes stop_codon:yes gene_type:complete
MLKSILSIIFVFLLSLPSLIGLEHFFDDNHHEVCTEGKVHFHEKESVCISCEFIRNLQDIKLDQNQFTFTDNQPISINYINRNIIYSSQHFLISFSRGPPEVSFI